MHYSKKKSPILRKYTIALIKLQLVIHQHMFECPMVIQQIFLAIGQLQAITLMVPNISTKSDVVNQSIQVIDYIIRPDLLFIWTPYGYLVGLCLFCIFDVILLQILVISQLQQKLKNSNMKEQLNHKSSFMLGFIKISALYSQFLHPYLYYPIQILSLKSLHYALTSTVQNDLLIVVISLISIIVIEFTLFIRKYICTITINLIINGFEKLDLTKFNILDQVITKIQLILYVTVQVDGQVIQGIICIFLGTFKIVNVLVDKNQPIIRFCQIILITQSFAITYAILQMMNMAHITYLIFPLIGGVLMIQLSHEVQIAWLAIPYYKKLSNIKLFISSYINQQIPTTTNLYIMHSAVILQFHRRKCYEASCYCWHIEPLLDSKKILYLTDQMIQRFLMGKLKQWNKQMNNKNHQIDCMHFISALYYLGFTTQAFQECNRMLNSIENRRVKGHQKHSEYSQSINEQYSKRSAQSSSKSKYQYHNKISKLKLIIPILSMINQQKVKIIQQDINSQLQNSFHYSQNTQQEDMALGIELFMQSETENEIIKFEVIQIIRQKLQFFQSLLSNQKQTSQKLFEKSKQLSFNLQTLEKKLQKQYEQFPSQKLQSINCFIQAEILNNYLQAFKIQNLTTISDEKLLNMKKMIKVNLFGKNVVYLIIQLTENLQGMQILKTSNNPQWFFSYSTSEFMKIQNIDVLLPMGIKNEHYLLVQNFLMTGRSKYFRNIELSFIKHPNGLMKPCQIYFDLFLGKTDDLSFTVFFEEPTQTNGYLLVDVNCIVGGVTASFFDKAGWKQSEIREHTLTLDTAYQTNITNIIPKFEIYVQNKEYSVKIYNAPLILLNRNILIQNKSLGNTQKSGNWTNNSNTLPYNATITIFCREIYGSYYYLIEVEELKLINLTQTQSIVDSNDNFKFSEIDDSQNEAEVNQPLEFNFIVDMQNDNDHHQQLDPVAQEQSFNQSFNQRLIPNQSMRKLIDTSKSATQQQKFFNAEHMEVESQSKKSEQIIQSNQRNVNQFYDVDLEQIDKEMRENIRMQLQLDRDKQNDENEQVDDRASQVSSLIGVRKSVFFKKYDIIQRIIARDRKPTVLFLSNALITAFLAMTFLHFVIVLSNTSTDFSRFLQEIDMLLFHSSFMTPFDMFMALRLQSSNYNNQLRLKIITQQEFDPLNKWLFSQFGYGYEQMQVNFIEQMSNPFLQEFFTDDYMLVKFQKDNSSDIYEVDLNFKESLFVLLNYQFRFKVAYDLGESLVNRAFVTYSYANYFNLHDKFEGMTLKILNYTKSRKVLIYEKWLTLWIPFLIISNLIVLFQFFVYRKYIQRYEIYLDLFKFADSSYVERDMERYKLLLNILTQDSDVVFKYQYDLEQKEKFMMTEKYKNEQKVRIKHESAKRKNITEANKLPNLFTIVFCGFLVSFYFVVSFFIQNQTTSYLDKYVLTADLYKLTSDLGFRVPGLFAQRYMSSIFPLFAYYNSTDFERLYLRMTGGLEDILLFTNQLTEFTPNAYLTNQEFIDTLNHLKNNSVCDILSKERQQIVKNYCNSSFQGNIQQGLSQALLYEYTELKTEMSINNFTIILSYQQYEVEGAFILVRAISNLVKLLKSGMVSQTNDHISQITELSVCYMIFCLIAVLLQYTIIWNYYDSEYYLVKRFLLLLPSSTLLLDDNFERRVRQFQVNK